MRLSACMCGLLLAVSGCASLPERMRIEVDGRRIELWAQGTGGLLPEGSWSTSEECDPDRPRFSLRGKGGTLIVLDPDLLQIRGSNGELVSLHRCRP